MKYLLLALLPATVLATGGHEPPPPKPPAPTTQVQGQVQGQEQDQRQTQGQEQSANSAAQATSSASAQGGAGGNSQASNAGVSQTVVTERSAPSLGQGSFAIQGCGVAGNMGHSGTGGASFLGFGFTPEQCYDFQLAQAYAAMGAVSTACAVLNASRAGQRAKKRGIPLPVCEAPIAAPVSQHVQPTPPIVINIPPPVSPPACTKAVRQCVRKITE